MKGADVNERRKEEDGSGEGKNGGLSRGDNFDSSAFSHVTIAAPAQCADGATDFDTVFDQHLLPL